MPIVIPPMKGGTVRQYKHRLMKLFGIRSGRQWTHFRKEHGILTQKQTDGRGARRRQK